MKEEKMIDDIGRSLDEAVEQAAERIGMRRVEMRKIVKIDPPKSGHYRLHFDDQKSKLVPRMTSKLGILDKPALKFWAANIERDYVIGKVMEMGGVQDAHRFPLAVQEEELRKRLGEKRAHQMRLKTAGAIGTSLHKAIQSHLRGVMGDNILEAKLLGGPADLEGPALLAYMAWEDWALSVSLEPTNVETMLGSELLDVAGTMDCAGWACNPEMDGRKTHTVFDWKSSARSKSQANGIYPESELQVCGYRALAIEMGLADDDSWAAVVRLPKNEDDPCLKEKEPFDVLWIDPERADYLAKVLLDVGTAYTSMKEAFPK